MSLGPVMMGLAGPVLQPEEREMLRHPLLGGVILFTRNYVDPEQLAALVASIHAVREPRLLVAVDHEGGRVQRFRSGFTPLPPVGELGKLYEQDRRRAHHLAEATGWLMASELLAVGIDFSFAPVLDLDFGVSTVIGDRAFHRQADIVTDLAHAYMIGMRSAGMAATGKHFPGHGAVREDSHIALPIDGRSYEDIFTEDLVPYERMIHFGLAGVMPAHVIYSAVDARPAGFSPFWIRDVLRSRLGFQGVVFSDDLDMAAAAVAGDYAERARAALEAGCDMVLACNHPEGVARILEALGVWDDPASHMRLARMHGRHSTPRARLIADPAWSRAVAEVRSYDPSPWLEMDV